MSELVTAVITTYKRKPEIVERALKSILAQTYENLEIFVVDDSPADYPFRDEVAATVKQYENTGVRYIPHSRNMGACAARNTGLEAAAGTYIGYLDDDDEWLPEKIEKQVAVFEKGDENLGLVYNCDIVQNEELGEIIYGKGYPLHGSVFQELLKKGNVIGGTSIPLMRTSALKEIGGFDISLKATQDYDVWLRIAEKYTIEFIDEHLNRYYIHKEGQITSNPENRLSARLHMIRKYEQYFLADPYLCWKKHMDIAWAYAETGKKKTALQLYVRYLWKQPLRVKENLRYLYLILR